MKSKISFFNGTLMRKNMLRFSPIWITYLVIWFVAIPLVMGVQLSNPEVDFRPDAIDVAGYIGGVLRSIGPATACVYGVILAMALLSYLYSARSVGMYHSLPIRRSGLYLSNYCSGLLLIAVPNAVIAVITAVVTLMGNAFCPGMILAWFLALSAMELFFYSFAVFCGMFTGQILALPVFYGILNGICLGLYGAIFSFVQPFLYGMGQSMPGEQLMIWLTPLLNLYGHVEVTWEYSDAAQTVLEVGLAGQGILAIYAVAGIVLAVLAYAVYSRRDSETAGDIVSVGWAKVLFRYGVALCAALTIGQGLYYLVFSRLDSVAVELACMIVVAFVGFWVARMLLQKSFRVLRGSLRGGVICAVILLALFAAARFDVSGYVSRVPQADRVQQVSVTISGGEYSSAVLTDEENIQQVCAIHQMILDERNQHEDGVYCRVELNYALKGGSALQRTYSLYLDPAQLDDDAALTGKLQALVDTPEYLRSNCLEGLVNDGLVITGGTLSYFEIGEYDVMQDRAFDAETGEVLRQALIEDADAGRIERIDLLDYRDADYSAERYVNGITLNYKHAGAQAGQSVYVSLSTGMTSTIQALKDLGVLNEYVTLRLESEQDAYYAQQDASYESEEAAGYVEEIPAVADTETAA